MERELLYHGQKVNFPNMTNDHQLARVIQGEIDVPRSKVVLLPAWSAIQEGVVVSLQPDHSREFDYDFKVKNFKILVNVSQDNVRVWPNPSGQDWHGELALCPYRVEAQESLKKTRRKLEDYLRKNPIAVISAAQAVEKEHGIYNLI